MVAQARYQPAQAQPDSYDSAPMDFQSKTSASVEAYPVYSPAQPWKPFYLQRWVSLAFAGTFAVLIIVLQVLLAFSNTHQGLTTSDSHLHYLWTYGPTAVITLVLAFWGRVEFQAKMVAPWHRMAKGPSEAKKTLLLDYLSMLPPKALVTALHNGDFAVASSVAISLLLRITTIISTALITLALTAVSYPSVPITIQDQLVDSLEALGTSGGIAVYGMWGLASNNLSFPPGISEHFAYQTFNTDLPSTAQLATTVDGMSNFLECETATLDLLGVDPVDFRALKTNMTVHVVSQSCDMQTKFWAPSFANKSLSSVHFLRFEPGSCSNSTDVENNRIAVIFGYMNYTIGNSLTTLNNSAPGQGPSVVEAVDANMFLSTQLICKPNYNISRVDVVQNGTSLLNISLSSNPGPRTLSLVRPWDIAAMHYASFDNSLVEGEGISPSAPISLEDGTPLDVTPVSKLMLGSNPLAPRLLLSLADASFLQDMAASYYRRFTSFLINRSLMQQATLASTGSAEMIENRLLVQALACHLMTGLLAAALLLGLVVAFTGWELDLLPHNPTTVVGKAALVANSPMMLRSLRNLGSARHSTIISKVIGHDYAISPVSKTPTSAASKGTFQISSRLPQIETVAELPLDGFQAKGTHPASVRPTLRFIVCLLLAGMIASLEVVLHISQQNDGLGDAPDDTYLHYLWTTLPAIALSLLALLFGSVDFQVRTLAPYSALRKGAPFTSTIGLDLQDRSLPRIVLKEIETGNYAALASTIALLVASLLTIFTSSLFTAANVPVVSNLQLQTLTSFKKNATVFDAGRDGALHASVAASLVLESNLTYPPFTYENLVFTEMAPPQQIVSSSSFTTINATIPAARPRLECRAYSASDIHVNFTLNYTKAPTISNPLRIDIDAENCSLVSSLSLETLASNLFISTGPNTPEEATFGVGGSTDTLPDNAGNIRTMKLNGACSNQLWIWGKFSTASNPPTVDVSALGCNETVEIVDVQTIFADSSLNIDASNPPQPIESSARLWIPTAVTRSLDYLTLPNFTVAQNTMFDPFFDMLATSRFALPLSVLGDSSQAAAVSDAIRFQHSIISAQRIDSLYRTPANQTNATLINPPISTAEANDAVARNATLTDENGRRRVVQDPASTRVLEAMLAAILILSIVSWVLMPGTNLLPRSPTSIASVVALLAGGNVFEHLPSGAETLSEEEIDRIFGNDCVFWMGWGQFPAENAKGFEERFGIFAVRPDGVGKEWERVDVDSDWALLGKAPREEAGSSRRLVFASRQGQLG